MPHIYKITSPTGKIYIGSSTNVQKRFDHYKYLQCKSQLKLYNSFKKYGVQSHLFEIVVECSLGEMIFLEHHYGRIFDVLSKAGLNLKLPKIEDAFCAVSDETRERMRLSATGRRATPEARENNRKAQLGKKMSKEAIEKTIRFHTGRKRSKEFCIQNAGRAKKQWDAAGRFTTDEIKQRARMAQARYRLNNPQYLDRGNELRRNRTAIQKQRLLLKPLPFLDYPFGVAA